MANDFNEPATEVERKRLKDDFTIDKQTKSASNDLLPIWCIYMHLKNDDMFLRLSFVKRNPRAAQSASHKRRKQIAIVV